MSKRKDPKDFEKLGRPCEVTPEMIAKLEYAFCRDANALQAYSYAGFGRNQYYKFLKDNPEFEERIKELQSNLGRKAKFQLSDAIERDQYGELSLKYLIKREPSLYSEKVVSEHQGEGGGPVIYRILKEDENL